jgi:hypothetical protein
MADKYGFIRKTLKDFPDAVQPLPAQAVRPQSSASDGAAQSKAAPAAEQAGNNSDVNKTREQQKLERANAINEILSKRVIKSKGPIYDDLERSVRHFLNSELGKIFGNNPQQAVGGFSNEEVELLKFFCQRLKDKGND